MDFEDIIKRGGWLELDDAQLLEKTAREINPKIMVEIGAAIGTSSMIFGLILKKTKGHLYSIEVKPEPQWYKNMHDYGIKDLSTLIKGRSPWIDHTLIPKPIDYLFIDGTHDTRWVLADYHYWGEFVRNGGRIAFHDYTNIHKLNQVKRAIEIILETDYLIKIGETKGKFGLIVFEKGIKNERS